MIVSRGDTCAVVDSSRAEVSILGSTQVIAAIFALCVGNWIIFSLMNGKSVGVYHNVPVVPCQTMGNDSWFLDFSKVAPIRIRAEKTLVVAAQLLNTGEEFGCVHSMLLKLYSEKLTFDEIPLPNEWPVNKGWLLAGELDLHAKLNPLRQSWQHKTVADLKWTHILDSASIFTIPIALSYPMPSNLTRHRQTSTTAVQPRVDWLNRAAHQSWFDQHGTLHLHVIFTYQPLLDVLHTGCILSGLEPCEDYVKTLNTNAEYLLAQLSTLAVDSVHCARHGDTDSMAEAHSLAYGYKLDWRGLFLYTGMSSAAVAPKPHPEVEKYAADLKRMDVELDRFCRIVSGASAASLPRTNDPAPPPRLVFNAGLEGSGHHLLMAIVGEFENGKHGSSIVRYPLPRSWHCDTWAAPQQKEFVEALQRIPISPSTDIIHTLPQADSFPMCGASLKIAQRRDKAVLPRLDWIWEASRDAGVALDVIFARRPITDSLLSVCVDRVWESCQNYFPKLVDFAKLFVAQLKVLDAQQIHCFRYGNHSSMERVMREVYGERFEPARVVKEVFIPGSRTRQEIVVAQEYEERLKELDEALEEQCQRAENVRRA
eukprot:NODE_3198_length_2076_cov_5.543869.p1 GENE.NODE_3198_length_2076_cov_5.543869~~NODE_3198_length_2076_cov_5.543869.p1  ORF type:complete len:596 (-),score=113.57 NODE_3198_length_2076_cov_5.543869:171-1958(-)